jgi:GNAT superfamily N-acetyltransferase
VWYLDDMPICHDPELIRPLLLKHEAETRSVYNLVFGVAGGRASWVRVDDLERPRAVLCRSRALCMYAENTRAAEKLVGELPKRWRLSFRATPGRLIPAVTRVRPLKWKAPCYMYVLDPKKLVIDRKHRVGFLTSDDVPLVTRYWPHGHSHGYIASRMRAGPTCAIRRNGKPAAWAITHDDGAMGILHVLDEYRGQGMARSITTALARRCLKAGVKPFMYILTDNKASISLTEAMGFDRRGVYCWFGTG